MLGRRGIGRGGVVEDGRRGGGEGLVVIVVGI